MIPNFIYQVKNNDLKLLKACIMDAVATVTHNMLRHVNGGGVSSGILTFFGPCIIV